MPRRIQVKIKVDVFRNTTELFADVTDNFFDERRQRESSSTTSNERPYQPFAASSNSQFSSTIHNVNEMDDQNDLKKETTNDYVLSKIVQDECDAEYAAFLANEDSGRIVKKDVRKKEKKCDSANIKKLKDELKESRKKCE